MRILENLFGKKKNEKSLSNKVVLLDSPTIEYEGAVTGVFGIKIYTNEIAPFINKGIKYPCSGAFPFSTMHDGQDQITIEFHFSHDGTASEKSLLKNIEITGFSERKANEAMVRVYFEMTDWKLTIWASDENNNLQLKIRELPKSA